MTTGVAALVGLVAFTGVVTTQAERIEVERDRANREAEISQRTEEFLISLFEVSAPSESRGSSVTALELLDQARAGVERDLVDQPEVHAHLMGTLQQAYGQLGIEPGDEESSDVE